MGSPLYPIPYDVVLHHITPYLNVQDLSRLMRTSRTYCAFMLRDEIWQHIRKRCTDVAPFLEYLVFNAFPWRPNEYNDSEGVRKKARLRKSDKKPYKFPRGGNWYVLKTYISKARDASSFRAFIRFHWHERPGIFYSTLSYTMTPFTIFQNAVPLTLNDGKIHCIKVATTAFVFLLQKNVEQGSIRCVNKTIHFYKIVDAYGNVQPVGHMLRQNAIWSIADGEYYSRKTPGFQNLFWGF